MTKYRRPIVLASDPPTFVEIFDEFELLLAEAIFAAQWRYVNYGIGEDELFSYTGVRITGRLVETNPDTLDEWGRRGEFDLAEVYRELFS